MINTVSMLAFYMPSLEMWVMFLGAASLPVLFVLWMFIWLRSVRDVSPEEAILAQQKADREHLAHNPHAPAQHGHAHATAPAPHGSDRPANQHHAHA